MCRTGRAPVNNDPSRPVIAATPGRPSNGVDASGNPLRRLITGAAFGIRSGEGPTAWLLFAYFFLVATVHYLEKSVRDSSYINTWGAKELPYAFLLVAVVSLPVIVMYSRFTAKYSQRNMIIGFAVIQAAGLFGFYWLFGSPGKWTAMAFYLWTTVAFGIGVSQFWSYANHRFDPRQARRLFAFVAAGGLLGAIPGGLIASLLASNKTGTTTNDALLVGAVLSLSVVVIVVLVDRRGSPPSVPNRRDEPLERLRSARGGLKAIKSSRLLILIALLVLLSMAVNQMVDVQFKWAVEDATQWETDRTVQRDERTVEFGKYYSLMGILGFLFQIFFTQRIHRSMGVAFGLRILPASVAVASALMIMATGGIGLSILTAAWLLKLSENGFRHGVEQSSRELLFMPVPSQLRLQAKAFIDVFVQRFARGATALALLPVALGKVEPKHLSWAILAVTGLWLWCTVLARREYVHSFREGLRTGGMDEIPVVEAGDVNTITTLVEAMGSLDPRQVVHSLEMLAACGQERLIPPLLLHHDDPLVRRKVLGLLANAKRTEAVPLIERAIGDADIEVRTAAIQALAVLKGEDAAGFMVPRLSDPDPKIRAAAVASLAGMSDPDLVSRAEDILNELVSSDDPAIRLEAARAVAEIREPQAAGSVIQLLYDSDRTVVRQAISAVRSRMERDEPNPMYIPILISLMGSRRLKHLVRQSIVAYGESAISALVLFMNAEEEQIWVRRNVPMTIARIDSPVAVSSLIDGLQNSDPLIRKKIIEALAFLRTHHPKVRIKSDIVARHIKKDVAEYLRCLADLWAISSRHETRFEGPYAQWQTAGRVPTLLQQVLAQRMSTAVDNIFGLLKMIHPARDIEATYRSLASGQQALRANALEYLDNSLVGSVRRDVFAVIDDAPTEEKLRKAAQNYQIEVETPEQTLGRLLVPNPENDPGEVVVFAAIHAVYTERIGAYYPTVVDLSRDAANPIIRETSEWVVQKLRLIKGPAERLSDDAPEAEGEGASPMKKLALIEKVVILQGVDLFANCNAEQVLQLASIASEIWFEAGGVVYQRNDPPDALYCIVEGRIDLTAPESETVSLTTGDILGTFDILRSQVRSRDATATSDTHALLIEAEDFFDLLGTNVEIVRALFRQLTLSMKDTPGGIS